MRGSEWEFILIMIFVICVRSRRLKDGSRIYSYLCYVTGCALDVRFPGRFFGKLVALLMYVNPSFYLLLFLPVANYMSSSIVTRTHGSSLICVCTYIRMFERLALVLQQTMMKVTVVLF